MVVARMLEIGGAYVAENAAVTGDVTLHPEVNVWFGCVLRADDAPITLHRAANLQDLTMVHADPGVPLTIEEEVLVGHRAILHCRRVKARALIGMGAVLLAGSVIGEEAIVGAGAVVPEGFEVPPRTLVCGVPARVVRDVTREEVEFNLAAIREYVRKARAYVAGNYLWSAFRSDPKGDERG